MFYENLRPGVSSEYYDIYKSMLNDVVPSHSTLFVLCCMIGYLYGERDEIDKKYKKVKLFRIESLNPSEEVILKSIAVKESNYDYNIIVDKGREEEIIRICEEFANNGMKILINEILNTYIKKENNKFLVDFTKTEQLSKILLAYVLQKYNEEPF